MSAEAHKLRREWPVLRRYEGQSRRAVSLPLGGIGTGTIGLGGRGELRDVELQNHPAKGTRASGTFFAVRAAGAGRPASARICEGALFPEEHEGALGSPVALAGLPRFSRCSFETTYPLGRVCLDDEHFPLSVRLEAFNPLVPGDAESSGLPIVAWRVRLRNTTAEPLEASVMCSVANFLGSRLRSGGRDDSRPTVQRRHGGGLVGVLLGDDALEGDDEEWGSFAAAVIDDLGAGEGSPLAGAGGGEGTAAAWVGPSWSAGKWNQGILRLWRGFVEAGIPGSLAGLGERDGSVDARASVPAATIGTTRQLEPLGSGEARFVFGWHFPNRRSWVFAGPGPTGGSGETIVGNHYCVGVPDAWAAIERAAGRLHELEDATVEFVAAVARSNLHDAVKEAALFNLSTLRSPTFFRAADGTPYGWEGVLDATGSCPGSCTHVWNYELAIPFLFPELARAMREVELAAIDEDGAMDFRIALPEQWRARFGLAAADGQLGCIVKLHREWQLSGDDAFLRRFWPAARRALEFAWVEGGWDADGDGVAEGALHNTLDIEYFGPTSIIQGWYLAALRAATRMAAAAGDNAFATRCSELEARGAAWTEENLFNGEYYQQEIRPPGDFARVHPRTRHRALGADDPARPQFQLGSGCLIDQLAGQVAAEMAGLGKVFDAEHADRSLVAVHRLNYVPRFADWSNYMRSYALGEDRGHIMVAYPGGVPESPVPYWCEVLTGFEYTYALALVQAGRAELAEDVVASIRERYDGWRRNPFDEAECGHHYARAMASWGLVNALAGFSYSAVERRVELAGGPPGSSMVWTAGGAWGTVLHGPAGGGPSARLEVRGGELALEHALLGGSPVELDGALLLRAGEHLDLAVTAPGDL